MLRYALSVTTAADQAKALHELADKLDPHKPAVQFAAGDFHPAAEQLREVAAHLERIATGGDADPAAEAAHRAKHA